MSERTAVASDRIAVEFRLRLTIARPDPASYARFYQYATANISDAYHKRQTLPHDIKPVYAGCPGIVGPAITVQVTPGDEGKVVVSFDPHSIPVSALTRTIVNHHVVTDLSVEEADLEAIIRQIYSGAHSPAS